MSSINMSPKRVSLRIVCSEFTPDVSVSDRAIYKSLTDRMFYLTSVARVWDRSAMDARLYVSDDRNTSFVVDVDSRSAPRGQLYVTQAQEGYCQILPNGKIIGRHIHPDVALSHLMLGEGSTEKLRMEPTSWWQTGQVALVCRPEGDWDVVLTDRSNAKWAFAAQEAALAYAQQAAEAAFVRTAHLVAERRYLRGEDKYRIKFDGIAKQLFRTKGLPPMLRPGRISSSRGAS